MRSWLLCSSLIVVGLSTGCANLRQPPERLIAEAPAPLAADDERRNEVEQPPTAVVVQVEAEAPSKSLPDPVEAEPNLAPSPTLHGYTQQARTEHFRLYGNFDSNWDRLAEICETTRARLREWLDAPPAHEPDPVDLFLVRDREEIRALEEAIGMKSRRNAVRQKSGGGYYHRHRTILLQLAPGKNLEWLVSHEACHSVFRKLTRTLPASLNEGLAELIPAWILFAESQPGPETVVYEYGAYARVCAQIVREDRVPDLRSFFEQSFDWFQSDRWTNFALAWSLFRMLMTSREEGVSDRLPILMERLADDSPAWEDFETVYDAKRVEELWGAELEELARDAADR